METYYTFIRSCTNWEEFSSAEKEVQEKGLTLKEARDMCKDFNNHRNVFQIEKGMKMEFQSE